MVGPLSEVFLLIVLSIFLSTSIQYPLSYAQIDLSGANLAPEEKSDIMTQAEVSKKTPDKAL